MNESQEDLPENSQNSRAIFNQIRNTLNVESMKQGKDKAKAKNRQLTNRNNDNIDDKDVSVNCVVLSGAKE